MSDIVIKGCTLYPDQNKALELAQKVLTEVAEGGRRPTYKKPRVFCIRNLEYHVYYTLNDHLTVRREEMS